MQKIIRTKQFKITTNTDFKAVIGHCAKIPRKGQNDTWITKDMQQAYLNLHQAGYAHSIEVWQAENLVGGLYGVQVNGVFCGESMFSLVSNASKTALVYLSNLNIDLIDCQLPNEHLLRLGAEMISREAYMHYLQKD